MIFFAKYLLRGPNQAAMAATFTALLSIQLPPLAWLSGGTVALVTLQQGHRAGLKVVMFATMGAVILAWIMFGAPWVVASFVMVTWLPVWLAAMVVNGATMDRAVQWTSLACLALVVMLYVFFPGFGEIWRQPIEQMVGVLESWSEGQISATGLEESKEWLIRLMACFFALSLFFNTLIGLFLGRWWQATLYNPGGFAAEYNDLRLGRGLAIAGVALFAAAYLIQSDMIIALAIFMASVYLVQGLAVAHGVLYLSKVHKVWVVVFYVLLMFIPHLVLPLIVLGIIDAWLDFRHKIVAAK